MTRWKTWLALASLGAALVGCGSGTKGASSDAGTDAGADGSTGACTLLAQNCPQGDACYLTTNGDAVCMTAGTTGGNLDACQAANDCLPGFICLFDFCAKVCDLGGGSPSCAVFGSTYACMTPPVPVPIAALTGVGICGPTN